MNESELQGFSLDSWENFSTTWLQQTTLVPKKGGQAVVWLGEFVA
ncbi:TPA: hypothetical protein ACOIT4_000311 [Enterococcus faecalis]|nr:MULTISPECIES: hypothetical protein [Enterococcus]EJU87089.1 hypothetical protein HMPREF1327_02589 [Enterococcus faecalis 599]MCT9923630.1 hypothetical protein [Enterococcus faecalis]MCT9926260.1 hypothetical protein [Enterococcus faecalis]MCU2191500.1 hypothetical protein [Enterococcus faecalis]MCU2206383.1 hypothetical protein [Enterococcus faecalis]